jgi:hypothetical protein
MLKIVWLCVDVLVLIGGISSATDAAPAGRAAAQPVFDGARFFPAKGLEQAMLHGRFSGSNTSAREGFEVLAEITQVPPAGKWTELSFHNDKPYRWIRYEAPPGSYGAVAEMEFCFGKRKAAGRTFGSFGWHGLTNWPRAFDGKTETTFRSDMPDGQYVGIDVGEWATAQTPRFDPMPCDSTEPIDVTLKCNTPGAVVRYSFAGKPTKEDGAVYTKPIHLDHTATIFAVAFKEGSPPSPIAYGSYIVGQPKPGLHTLHLGNSLTASTLRFSAYLRTAGYVHDYQSMLKAGGQTVFIWNGIQSKEKADWGKMLAGMPTVDAVTVQPRPAHYGDADRAEEAKYDVLFFDLVRAKSRDAQPWIYAEWPGRRPGDRSSGWAPIFDSQMKELYPTTTFEEATASLFMHIEGIRDKVLETDKQGKRPRILPCSLALVRLKNLLDEAKFPGFSANDLDEMLFYDNVHPGDPGRYLLCLTWFAAFYRQSPEGLIAPIGTDLTAAQAAILQRLAWDVVKNYPDCGLYEEGATPCAAPTLMPAESSSASMRQIHLASATPGCWFRYTLDGTTPTRTHGYIYCGVISVRPGTTVKAIAYQCGMADSAVAKMEPKT